MPIPKNYTTQAEMNRRREEMHKRLAEGGSPIIPQVDTTEEFGVPMNPKAARGSREKKKPGGRNNPRGRRIRKN